MLSQKTKKKELIIWGEMKTWNDREEKIQERERKREWEREKKMRIINIERKKKEKSTENFPLNCKVFLVSIAEDIFVFFLLLANEKWVLLEKWIPENCSISI